jgi:hypothetical protein
MFLRDKIVAENDHVFNLTCGAFSIAIHLKKKLAWHPLVSLDHIDLSGGKTIAITRFEVAIG